MITLLFPHLARAAESLPDLAPPALVTPALFGVNLVLATAIAFLGTGHGRTRRSLALLIVLVSSLGLLMQLLNLPLNAAASLAVFIGVFVVIYLMGRFDAPD